MLRTFFLSFTFTFFCLHLLLFGVEAPPPLSRHPSPATVSYCPFILIPFVCDCMHTVYPRIPSFSFCQFSALGRTLQILVKEYYFRPRLRIGLVQ
jgi:hypothetical protein